jgi:hypothetical protein
MAEVKVRTSRSLLFKKIQADLVGTLTMYFGDEYHTNLLTGKGNKSTADIAEILIRGSKNISARPVFRQFVKNKKSDIETLMKRAYRRGRKKGANMRDILRDYVAPELKELFAQWVISGGVRPRNDPLYADRKRELTGSTAPFYATGYLVDALEVEVE